MWHGHPFDPIESGEIALLVVVGIAALATAHCLKSIEQRLTKIENERRENSN
jgi:cell division protein ZapA (FtsZ GTPase activity inhibitor)